MRIVQEENYRPNALAANLRRKVSDVIGYFQFDRPTLENSRMAQRVETVLFEAGFKTFHCNASGTAERKAFYLEEMITRKIAGAILHANANLEQAIAAAEKLEKAGIPALLLGTEVPRTGVSTVSVDYRQGWETTINHLARLGHRKVAYLEQNEGDWTAQMPHFSSETSIVTIPLDEELPLKAGVEHALTELREKHGDATALFCGSENVAMTAIQLLSRLGTKVPEDMSVVCLSGTGFGRMVFPSLTVVNLPVQELGEMCAHQLLNRIRQPDRAAVKIRIESQLVEGGSTALVNLKK